MACPECNAADARGRQGAREGLEGEGGVVETVVRTSEAQQRARRDTAAAALSSEGEAGRVIESVVEASEAQLRARRDTAAADGARRHSAADLVAPPEIEGNWD